MIIWSELDHRLSVVKRWGILHTLQTQSVAEHHHNVAKIAVRIWGEWLEGRKDQIVYVYDWALNHDNPEALSGDLPSMVKPYFNGDEFEDEHRKIIPKLRPFNSDIGKCVKLADKMEGYYFLSMELALGNKFVINHFNEETRIIYNWVQQNYPGPFPENVLLRVMEWMESVSPHELKSTRYSMRNK